MDLELAVHNDFAGNECWRADSMKREMSCWNLWKCGDDDGFCALGKKFTMKILLRKKGLV